MSSTTRMVSALALAGVLGTLALLHGALVPSPARADEPAPAETEKKRPTVDSSDVYLGNASNFSKPAEVDADAVYAEIPAYKEIVDEDVEVGSARYELLLNKASKQFKSALRKIAKSGGYDLIARSGSIRNADSVPDVTQDVIGQL